METVGKIIFGALALFGILLVIAALMGFPVMLLWNWLIPIVFPGLVTGGYIAGKITFWQAVGLTLLAGMFFKSSNSSSKD